MAALVVDATFDWDQFARRLGHDLPAFARPLFVRLLPQLDMTGTFKTRKVDLVREGFDPAEVGGEMRFADPASGRFVPLTPELHTRITAGTVRL
jgi:fatty-acyl-CoA synthase